MEKSIPGIHHLTAIASDPQRNLDFYTGTLGLRLVKLTVNFDDPGTYHLYFGDGQGRPGTILTFFPWPSAPRGIRGTGEVTTISFAVPEGALAYWAERLQRFGVNAEPEQRFGEQALAFADPDGMLLELMERPAAALHDAWADGPVPAEVAIRGFSGVTLSEIDHEDTAPLLTEIMGFRPAQQEGLRFRYVVGAGADQALVDILEEPETLRGALGAGSVHHIAWRTPGDEEQLAWRQELLRQGLQVTSVRDRQYFHSIYFREPGGVLFEIATDPPGFATDETPDQLGAHLKLPPWLEPERARLENVLPRLRLPGLPVEQ
jgi:glyoxalase family protein